MTSLPFDVVIDTSPLRDLAHCRELPPWVAAFAEMKRCDGIRFSVADHAFGELLNQRASGGIQDPGFTVMIEALETFVDPHMPIALGGRDVFAAIGALPPADDAASKSQEGWRLLRSHEITHDTAAAEELEEDREAWKTLFSRVESIYLAYVRDAEKNGQQVKLDELDHPVLRAVLSIYAASADIAPPPLSVRLDLQIRYFWRQFVRSQKGGDPYNVHAPKKRNDGIDFGLYTFLALPVLAVASERGFHEAIENIPSFQKPWIYRPSELARVWSFGSLGRPEWPA